MLKSTTARISRGGEEPARRDLLGGYAVYLSPVLTPEEVRLPILHKQEEIHLNAKYEKQHVPVFAG
ncbi:MAG: hypothetical protein AABX70_07500 [Nanoarchaeota archaeon]